MKADLTDRNVLREFLLGGLSEEERVSVEERLMTNDAYFEEFELVKEEVIDQYAEGEMTSEDRKKFEQHFLTTPSRRLSLRLAQTLITDVPAQHPKKARKKTGLVALLSSWFRSLSAMPLRTAVVPLAAIAVAALVWMVFFRPSTTIADGLRALGEAYREQRPIEARVSDFPHARWANTRSGDEVKFDRAARSRAEVLLHSAADKEPGSVSQHALGKLLLLEGKYNDAIIQFEEALKTDGNNPRIHSDLGAALLQRGELEVQKGDGAASSESFGKSLDHLQRALEIDPSLHEALFNRALVREQFKLFQLAQDDWKAYLEKDSTSPWAEEARQKLKALQERPNTTTQTADQLFQSFLVARQSGDDQTTWKLLNESRDYRGSSIENRLLDEYLTAAGSGRIDEAGEKLQALTYAGDVGFRVAGDKFTSDLVKFYATAPSHKQTALIEARRLIKLGHDHLSKDRTSEALEHYAAARKIFEENGDAPEALLSRYTSAHSHLLQSEANESLKQFEWVSREAEAKHYRWFEGQSLNGLANVHIGFNNYSAALELSQRSLRVLEDIGDIVGVVKVNDQLGAEYLRLGNPREALRFHHHGVALASANPFGLGPLWRTYFLAAVPFHALGLIAASIDFTKESLLFAEKNNAHLSASRSCSHLGLMYGSRGSYTEAMSYVQRAVESGKRVETERVRKNALGYASLQMGNLYKLQGEFSRASESYDEAIQLFEQLNFNAFSYVAHKGKFLSCVAQPAACPSVEQELKTTLDLYEGHRSKILETKNRYSFFDTEQNVYDVAIDYEFTTKNDKMKAFDYSEGCRARSLLDPSIANYQQQGHHPAGNLPTVVSIGLNAIQSAMPDEAQIVQYAVLSDKLLIWVVSRTRFEGFQQPISMKSLEEKVSSYMRLIESRSDSEETRRRAAAELYDLLIKPVENLLDKDKLLCIVPDKILNRLPFSSLFLPAQGRYLIEDYALTFSPSSTVFVQQSKTALERSGSGPERLLSVGDPWFDQKAFPAYRHLPAAGVEARAIAEMYKPRELLIEGNATEDRIVHAMKDADVIHIATHAVADQYSPMYSKLLLAKPSDVSSSDGVLLTSEIYHLDLRARLVVLPACRTAVEQHYGGEGMVGIWSPFMTRHVPLVVASLWAIDSDSTKELMIDFHKLRRSGLPSTYALQQAQIRMLKGETKSFQHPYHWASFIAIGGQTRF